MRKSQKIVLALLVALLIAAKLGMLGGSNSGAGNSNDSISRNVPAFSTSVTLSPSPLG